MKIKNSVTDLFNNAKFNNSYLKVCAPMVRYSKVQFRTLVKNFGVDLCFTPMILADSFCQNSKARTSEFSTTISDSPLIVQFAANNVNDFVDASKLVFPYADGVDLNCGCPQKWAMKDGVGCALLYKPESIHTLIKELRNSLPSDFSVSVKIRILKDLKDTINTCQQLEKCGVTFLTVHGRTPEQKSGDKININALKEICDVINLPIIANGGVKTLKQADELYERLRCDGVMAASGLLTNPALFSGVNTTPESCIKLWKDMKDKDTSKITYQCYHHHLVFMLEKVLTKQEKQIFNHLNTFEEVDKYINENILNTHSDFLKSTFSLDDFVKCSFDSEITIKHTGKCRGCTKSIYYCICNKYDYNEKDGNYFTSFVKENEDELDYMDSSMFKEHI